MKIGNNRGSAMVEAGIGMTLFLMTVLMCLDIGVIGFTRARLQYVTQAYTEHAATYNRQMGVAGNWRDTVFKNTLMIPGWASSGIFSYVNTLDPGDFSFSYVDKSGGASTGKPGDYYITTVTLDAPLFSPVAWTMGLRHISIQAVGIARIE